MNISNALKDRKFREGIIIDFILFVLTEFMLYIAFFEWNYSIKFKVYSIIVSGIITIISIILLSLGIVNKNRNNIVYSIEVFVLALFIFLSYYILSYFPNNIKIANKSIYIFIPFIVFFVYYIGKIGIRIKNKLQK